MNKIWLLVLIAFLLSQAKLVGKVVLIQVLNEAKPFIWFLAWYLVNHISLGLYIVSNEINMRAL